MQGTERPEAAGQRAARGQEALVGEPWGGFVASELLLLMIFALLFCCLIEWLSTAGQYVYGECFTQLSEMLHYLHVFLISFSANPLCRL